jgi:serine/threonine protein kinase
MEPGVRFCPNDGTPLTDTAAAPTVTLPNNATPTTKVIDLPGVVGGRYRLEHLLGGGGMAKVYRGVDLTLEREVAVKLINPELRTDPEFDARFQREAKIASQLSDPHIIVVHDFGIDPTYGPFLVMELLQGGTLRERLQAEGPLPLKAGLQLSAQLMLALLHAHEKGIVHRDIKPDNIFVLNQSGVRLHVRVLDFGIARIYKRDEPSRVESLTATGAVLGTPRYMSPEQLAGKPVDARSDLYSAALVVYESLTGQLPYVTGKKLTEMCPDATKVLEDLIDHCLKANPEERPPSAVEVYLRLQELGKASGVLLLPTGAMDKLVAARHAQQTGSPAAALTRKQGSRLPLYFVIGMTILIALLGLLSLGKRLLFPPMTQPPSSAAETLLGIKVGDPEAEVLDKLTRDKLPLDKETFGHNPWEQPPPPAYLGHILQPSDLGLADEELKELDVKRTTDEHVCVIFHKGKVLAVVVREPHKGMTDRGVGIHSNVNDLFDHYKDFEATKTETIPFIDLKLGKQHGEVRRYDQRGIAFLIQGTVITSITLYPAKTAQ